MRVLLFVALLTLKETTAGQSKSLQIPFLGQPSYSYESENLQPSSLPLLGEISRKKEEARKYIPAISLQKVSSNTGNKGLAFNLAFDQNESQKAEAGHTSLAVKKHDLEKQEEYSPYGKSKAYVKANDFGAHYENDYAAKSKERQNKGDVKLLKFEGHEEKKSLSAGIHHLLSPSEDEHHDWKPTEFKKKHDEKKSSHGVDSLFQKFEQATILKKKSEDKKVAGQHYGDIIFGKHIEKGYEDDKKYDLKYEDKYDDKHYEKGNNKYYDKYYGKEDDKYYDKPVEGIKKEKKVHEYGNVDYGFPLVGKIQSEFSRTIKGTIGKVADTEPAKERYVPVIVQQSGKSKPRRRRKKIRRIYRPVHEGEGQGKKNYGDKGGQDHRYENKYNENTGYLYVRPQVRSQSYYSSGGETGKSKGHSRKSSDENTIGIEVNLRGVPTNLQKLKGRQGKGQSPISELGSYIEQGAELANRFVHMARSLKNQSGGGKSRSNEGGEVQVVYIREAQPRQQAYRGISQQEFSNFESNRRREESESNRASSKKSFQLTDIIQEGAGLKKLMDAAIG